MRKIATAAALAASILTLTACDLINDIRGFTPDSVTVTITGVPADMTPDVTVTGPAGYNRRVTETTTLDRLAPGEYTITAATIEFKDNPLDPDANTKTVTLAPGGAQSVTVAYAPHREYSRAVLEHLNRLRAEVGVTPVKLDADNSTPNWLHARYLRENNVSEHDEDPSKPFYTPEGHAAGRSSNIGSAGGGPDYEPYEHPERAASAFLNAPLHLFRVLDPRATSVRIGVYRTWICWGGDECPTLRSLSSLVLGTVKGGAWPEGQVVRFPANDQTALAVRFVGENPEPLTACPGYDWPAGLPIFAMHGRDNLPDVKATRLERDGEALEHCTITADTYTNPDPVAENHVRNSLTDHGAVIIIPREPLEPGSAYEVTIEYATHTDTWTFHTADEDDLIL